MPDPAFENVKGNEKEFLDYVAAKTKRFEQKYGTYEQLQAQILEQDREMRRCYKCKELFATMNSMYNHVDSLRCRKRVAELQGTTYTPPSRMRVVCECGLECYKENLEKHTQGRRHAKNMKLLSGEFSCHLCNKDFNKAARPQKAYNQHCKGKKHLRLVAEAKIKPVVLVV